MEKARGVFWSSLPPQCKLDELTGRLQTCLGLRCGDHGEKERERLPDNPNSCFSPHHPLQAQTRAALLRALQEDEEHWGSTEDWPSSLAQDVCEVGAGRWRRIGWTVPGGEVGAHPLFIPSHPLGPCSCWKNTQSERPASAGSLGSGWLTAAWGRWRSSCRGMVAVGRSGIGGRGGRCSGEVSFRTQDPTEER